MHLPHHRRSRSLGDHLFRGLANAFATGIALEAIILATATGGGVPPAGSGTAAWSRVDQASGPEMRLMQEHGCSTTGYDDSVTPQSAIVRSRSGRLRVVSFEQGWAVYTGPSSATLVAFCPEPPPSADAG